MSPGSPTINQFRSTDDDPFGAKKYVLSEDQLMLLYLLSKHASPAETVEEHETWSVSCSRSHSDSRALSHPGRLCRIRENQLLVLIYEGILAGQDNTDIGFQDYDYAPTSVLVGHKVPPPPSPSLRSVSWCADCVCCCWWCWYACVCVRAACASI